MLGWLAMELGAAELGATEVWATELLCIRLRDMPVMMLGCPMVCPGRLLPRSCASNSSLSSMPAVA